MPLDARAERVLAWPRPEVLKDVLGLEGCSQEQDSVGQWGLKSPPPYSIRVALHLCVNLDPLLRIRRLNLATRQISESQEVNKEDALGEAKHGSEAQTRHPPVLCRQSVRKEWRLPLPQLSSTCPSPGPFLSNLFPILSFGKLWEWHFWEWLL